MNHKIKSSALSGWFRRWWPCLVILAVVLVFSHPIWLGKVFWAGDVLKLFFPWKNGGGTIANYLISDPVFHNYVDHTVAARSLREGGISFWRNDLMCGMPFFGYWQNPLMVVLRFGLPTGMMHNLLLFTNLLLCGIASFTYLRLMRFRNLPALTGSLAWMLNGFVMVWFEYQFAIGFAFALAVTLLFIEKFLRRCNLFNWVGLALGYAYAIAIGFPHLLLYYLIFTGIYFVFRAGPGSNLARGRFLRCCGSYGGALAMALLAGLGFVVGNLFALQEGQRVSYTFSQLFEQTGQLYWRTLVTALLPDFYGAPDCIRHFFPGSPSQIYNNYNELCIYAGTGIIILAFIGLAARPRRMVFFYAMTAVIALWSAMGGIVYYPLSLIPGLAVSSPTRILFLWGFCLAFLAAAGLQSLVYGRRNGRLALIVSVSVLLLVWTLAITVNTTVGCRFFMSEGYRYFQGIPKFLNLSEPGMIVPLLGVTGSSLLICVIAWRRHYSAATTTWLSAILVVVLTGELLCFGMRYNTAIAGSKFYQETAGIRMLMNLPRPFRILPVGGFAENSFSPFGIESIGGYQSIYPVRYAHFMHMLSTGISELPERFNRWLHPTSINFPLLSLLNVRYLIMEPGSPAIRDPRLKLVYDGELKIYQNKLCFPRAFWVPNAVVEPDPLRQRQLMCSSEIKDLLTRVVIDKPFGSAEPKNSGKLNLEYLDRIAITTWKMNELVFATTIPEDGYIVVSNNYDPFWQAEVDGHPVTLRRGDYTLQTIALPAGNHQVRLFYRPTKLIAMTVWGYLVWLVLLGLLVYGWRRGRRGVTTEND